MCKMKRKMKRDTLKQLEHFPKSGNRFLDKKCDKNKELEQIGDSIKSHSALSETALVRLEQAGVFRQGRWLVRHIDLEIRPGEIITLIGPNGSGKSTTAKMALRILKADAGQIWQRPGLRVGYVPQKITIDNAMPLNVARLMRLTTKLSRSKIEAALDEVGVLSLIQAPISTLSGGELQRVLLARAAATKPDLLVLDEPLQGVDVAGEAALYALISSYRDRLGCGVLLISHDLHIVMATSDHVFCLNGTICCRGKPEEVAASDEYRALFLPHNRHILGLYQHHHQEDHQSAMPVISLPSSPSQLHHETHPHA